MAIKLIMPKTVWLGKCALADAERDICSLGTKALIVTGHSMIRQGHMNTLTGLLDKNGVQWEIYSAISGEPTNQMIEAGVTQYKDKKGNSLVPAVAVIDPIFTTLAGEQFTIASGFDALAHALPKGLTPPEPAGHTGCQMILNWR